MPWWLQSILLCTQDLVQMQLGFLKMMEQLFAIPNVDLSADDLLLRIDRECYLVKRGANALTIPVLCLRLSLFEMRV